MFHNSTTCKKCNSENTQSFQMVYESGTSSVQMNFVTYDGDGIGVGGGRTQNQSLLAQKVSPPESPDWTGGEMGAVIAVPIGIVIFTVLFFPFWMALIFAGVGGFLTWYAIDQQCKKRRPIYNLQMARWMRSWLCHKCGAVWELKS